MKAILKIVCATLLISCNQSGQNEKEGTTLTTDSVVTNNLLPAIPSSPQVAEGTDLFGAGNIPHFTLEIDFEKSIHFKSGDSIDLTVPIVKGVRSADGATTRYTAKTGTHELIVEISRNDCVNEGTGERSDLLATVSVKTKDAKDYSIYRGCASYFSYHGLNGVWVLEGINNTMFNPADFGGGMPYMNIDLSKKEISGYSGCGGMGGNFQVKDNTISFDKIKTNKSVCPNQNIESAFIRHFSGRNVSFEFKAARLVFQATADSSYIYRRIQ